MRFLTVAERELRTAARKKSTYVIRWLTATAFFLLLVWVMWVSDALKYQGRSHEVFLIFSALLFIYCLVVGAVRTADCLSSERREGTLGLLFLTNLNSFEIIAGKLCSSAVPTVYALLSIFPMLGIPLLMGGVTLAEFWRTVLALLGTILFSLAAGFVASVFCKRQFTAVALAMALALIFGAGMFGAAAIVHELNGPKALVEGLSVICPLYTWSAAAGGRVFGLNKFWLSLASVAGLSITWLALVIWQLARSWRDRPKSVRTGKGVKSDGAAPSRASASRARFRRRLLDINPFYWLAGRRLLSAPIFICLIAALVLITSYVTVPYFARVIPAGKELKPMIGSLMGWAFSGITIHLLVLYYAAMISSQRLAEDKEAGALELVLSTPVTERSISRGLWMAFTRRMFFPALVAILVHAFFLWQCMVMATIEPPGQFPRYSATPWEIFRAVLLDEPIRGHSLEWGFIFLVRIALLILVMLPVVWLTLGWVARWFGLRMKHPGFAPMIALALVFVPPVLLFSLVCFVADELRLNRMPQRQLIPLMLWVVIGIGLTHCLLLCTWAAQRLRINFRETVIGRFDSSLRRWLPDWRMVLRLALRAMAFAVALVLVVVAFYIYQGHRSRNAWDIFQADMKKRGQSLDLAPLLLPPVPDNANFARSRAFQDIVSAKNRSAQKLTDAMQFIDVPSGMPGQKNEGLAWMEASPAPLGKFARYIDSERVPDESIDNSTAAPIILKALQRHDETFRALSIAAQLPSFQVTTNRTALAVLQPRQQELQVLDRLHFLFTIRANARLETGEVTGAEEDLLTSLRLARLAGQSPDEKSPVRGQVMLARSLQPLWEGLAGHKWNESHLAALQSELDRFNLLVSYTNAVHRLVLANIEIWKEVPGSKTAKISLPAANGGFYRNSNWQGQPRAWWYYNCIELYRLGEKVVNQMDVPGERVWINGNWGELANLPLDSDAQHLLGQYPWQGGGPALIAFAQTSLNQARIACALERYRLAHGRYPAKLDQLVPVWLKLIPNDVSRGQPIVYEPIKEESYCLRAFGPDQVNGRTNSMSDDWLWAYPTNTSAAVQSP